LGKDNAVTYGYDYQRGQFEIYLRQIWQRHRHRIWIIPVVVIVILLISSILYSIAADSEGVILRFGKYARSSGPGLHTKLPWPIETVYEVPVERVESLEFGFATVQPGKVTEYARATPDLMQVATMLTGDLSLAHVEWIVQYRVADARDYLFKIGGSDKARVAVGDTIRDVSEAVMRKLVGDSSVDEVITIGRFQIAADAKQEIQKALDDFEAGIEVVTVKLQAVTPPAAVKDAFDEVNRARQRKERVVNDALGERNQRIPAARGQRDRAILEAEGYRERVVREMTGRVNAFLAQLEQYKKSPEVTRSRLYLEVMEQVLSQVDQKIVIDDSIRSMLPLLNLDDSRGGKSNRQETRK
jgi:membrane protease subunit HflK